MSFVSKFLRTIIPPAQTPLMLGRWNLKHNFNKCEEYINNYHGDPGYPNILKEKWIEVNTKSELNDDKNKDSN